jgi:hypothetical protein
MAIFVRTNTGFATHLTTLSLVVKPYSILLILAVSSRVPAIPVHAHPTLDNVERQPLSFNACDSVI